MTQDNVNDSILIERQYTNSNNNDGKYLPLEKLEYTEEGKKLIGLSVSDGIKKSYGISHLDTTIIRELGILSKFPDIINAIDELKCFTFNYLCFVLERTDGDRTIKRIISILVRREILIKRAFIGKSKRTFTLYIYHNHMASDKDIEDTLREYKIGDEARHLKDLQRKTKKKSPKEIVDHNKEVSRLSSEKLADPNKCCDWTRFEATGITFIQHSNACGKGVVKESVNR